MTFKNKSLLGGIGAAGICVLFVVSCASTPEPVVVDANWLSRMHRLSAAMTEIMPLTADSGKFFDPKNSETIKHNLNELAQASAELARDQNGPGDPLIHHTARVFAQDMAYAANHFGNGNKQMSQFLAGNIPVYCISCHTRTDRGTQDFPMTWSVDLKRLSGSQKTQYYLANRQYDSAVKEANLLVKNSGEIKSNLHEWRKAIESTLAMFVRVERNVEKTIGLVNSVAENSSVPSYIRTDAQNWLKDAKHWRADALRTKKQSPAIEQKFQTAKDLVLKGQTEQKQESHSALISSLRASALLHEVIEQPRSNRYGESLYLAGVASELLRDVIVPGLNEAYYESCINAVPHTKLAEKCYGQLEISVQKTAANYTENAVISDLRAKHLLELSLLSQVGMPRMLEKTQ